tara:strand:- start:115383 stop:115649 length:267 start_codon:yes stop_codon:yes gene_type:complete
MISGHMCCGIVGEMLMARVGPDSYEECLQQKYAQEMDFTGKFMKGMVYVLPEGIESDVSLFGWVGMCESYVKNLPLKKHNKALHQTSR